MTDGDEMRSTLETDDRDELRGLLGMQTRRRPAVLTEGQVLGEAYQILRELGAGGMGVVYLARDTRLKRDVAIKVHATVAGERLLREAAALAQLVHGNVVTVHEVGTWIDHPYVVMEYVPGGTARTWVTKGRSVREIVSLYLAAGRGLAAAHEAGLVHRDFKPDNVLVGDDGRVRVADFGLARAHGEADGVVGDAVGEVTRTGTVMGTPAYMAPEQKAGGTIGPAADQYAFAVSLWEALCGRRPPEGQVPRNLSTILRRALAERPDDRWPSMDALLAELARVVRPSRAPWIAAGVVALGAAAGGAWMLRGGGDAGPPPCAAAKDDLAGIWDGPQQAAVRSATGALFDRVGSVMDGYTAEWSAQRIEACEATTVRHQQTAEVMARRDHCLDERRATLRAVATALADPATAARALDETTALEPVADCSDATRLAEAPPLPDDPAIRAQIDAVDTQLGQVSVLYYAGKMKDARAIADPTVTQAVQLGYPPQVARARYLLGNLQMLAGEDATEATFELAGKDAAAAHDDDRAARIWIGLLGFYTMAREDLVAADRIVPFVEAALVRAGTTPELESGYLTYLGGLRDRQHRFADAKTALERALALDEQLLGKDHPRLATPLDALAWALQYLGDQDGARASEQRAIDLVEHAYGPDDVHLATLLDSMANFEGMDGKVEDALARFQQTLALKEKAFGPDSTNVAITLSNMCQALMQLDRAAEALPLAKRAVAIYEKQYGPDAPPLTDIVGTLADVAAASGDLVAGRTAYDRAVAIAEKTLPHDDPGIGNIVARRGYLLITQIDAKAGRADLARAHRISAAHPEDTELTALLSDEEADIAKNGTK